MPSDQRWWVTYPDGVTEDDRLSLDRPGFRPYENGYGVSAVWQGDEGPSQVTTHQVIRLSAENPDDARRKIVEVLGREPQKLQISEGRPAA